MNIIAIVPAKGESKRLPGKNLKLFCGKPLLEWTLIQCKFSKYINTIYLVTDSKEIAELGEKYGAKIVWQTKEQIDAAEAAGQMGGAHSMVLGMRQALKDAEGGEPVHGVYTMLATNPLRKVDDLDKFVDMMRANDRYPVMSMCRMKDMHLFKNNGHGAIVMHLLDKEGQFLRTNASIQFWLVHQFLRYYLKEDGETFNTADDWIANKDGFATVTPIYHDLWQEYDIDDQQEFDICEYWMNKGILKGRGAEIYEEYRAACMSEYGYKQNAAQYNKGVEINLLPFEYKSSFFNHMELHLESQRDEKMAGYEMIEHYKDGTKKSVRFWRANSAFDVLSQKLEQPKPALIIGSGPSLDEAGKYLGQWKGATFCSTSQATTLVKYGLTPSHIIAYDVASSPEEISRIDTPWETKGTKLIIHPGVNPKLHNWWKGDKLLFRSQDSSNYFFQNILPIAYQDIIQSQMYLFSCSLAAQMSVAKAMGYSPLFFVGCDFAAARFSRWYFEDGEWKCDPGTHISVSNTAIMSANGIATDALSVFYKRSTLCVWRIDHAQCFMTSKHSVLTEMPYADIQAVIAYQGEGFEGFTDQQIEDAAEIYLAHFNQFVVKFIGTGVKVIESPAEGDAWKADVEAYMLEINRVGMAQDRGQLVDISANMERFKWLKEQVSSRQAEQKLTASLTG